MAPQGKSETQNQVISRQNIESRIDTVVSSRLAPDSAYGAYFFIANTFSDAPYKTNTGNQ
jgi:hypothetical protein